MELFITQDFFFLKKKSKCIRKGAEGAEQISNAEVPATAVSCTAHPGKLPVLQRGQESPCSPCQSDHLTLETNLTPTGLEAEGKLCVLKLPSLPGQFSSSPFMSFLLFLSGTQVC